MSERGLGGDDEKGNGTNVSCLPSSSGVARAVCGGGGGIGWGGGHEQGESTDRALERVSDSSVLCLPSSSASQGDGTNGALAAS